MGPLLDFLRPMLDSVGVLLDSACRPLDFIGADRCSKGALLHFFSPLADSKAHFLFSIELLGRSIAHALDSKGSLLEIMRPHACSLFLRLARRLQPISPRHPGSAPVLRRRIAGFQRSARLLHPTDAVLPRDDARLLWTAPLLQSIYAALPRVSPLLHWTAPLLHQSARLLHSADGPLPRASPLLPETSSPLQFRRSDGWAVRRYECHPERSEGAMTKLTFPSLRSG
jgi:hypothetical protein